MTTNKKHHETGDIVMSEIFVLTEHRQGKIRDITYEMLGLGEKIATQHGAILTAVLLGKGVNTFGEDLATRASKVLVVEDDQLENFNSLVYQKVLSSLMSKYQPFLTLIGHTAFGMDLAPSLSVEMGCPMVTDCIGLSLEGNRLKGIRSIYGGKVNANISLKESKSYIAPIRPGGFSPKMPVDRKGGISVEPPPPKETADAKNFLIYIEAPITGEDITQEEIIIAVGQGIGGPEHIQMIEEVAKNLG